MNVREIEKQNLYYLTASSSSQRRKICHFFIVIFQEMFLCNNVGVSVLQLTVLRRFDSGLQSVKNYIWSNYLHTITSHIISGEKKIAANLVKCSYICSQC